MTLEEYLQDSRDELPPDGAVGTETEWLSVATLELTTGKLWIGDPQFAWAEANEGEGCLIELPNGSYQVEAKGVDFAGSRFVSRIRVYRAGSTDIAVGDEIGEAGTDSAQIGVADQQALKAAFDESCGDDVDAALDMLEENIDGAVGVFEPVPDGDGRLVFLPSGVGDGGGPVFELLEGRERVGIEHAFIDARQPF